MEAWKDTGREEDILPQKRQKRGYPPPPFWEFIHHIPSYFKESFIRFMAIVANHIGTEVEEDPDARVVEIWHQDKAHNLEPAYSTALDGDYLIPAGFTSREYFLDLETKDGPVTIKVSKDVHDRVSYQDPVIAKYRVGQFDDSDLKGLRVVLPEN